MPTRRRRAVSIHLPGKDVLAVEPDIPLDADTRDQVVHPVERFEERGLAAAGGADEGRDLLLAACPAKCFSGP